MNGIWPSFSQKEFSKNNFYLGKFCLANMSELELERFPSFFAACKEYRKLSIRSWRL